MKILLFKYDDDQWKLINSYKSHFLRTVGIDDIWRIDIVDKNLSTRITPLGTIQYLNY